MNISVIKDENGVLMMNPKAAARKQSEMGRRTLFAGNLNQKTDTVSKIRERAQKKAGKIIGDVFGAEKNLDNMVQEMKEQSAKLLDDRAHYAEELQRVYGEQAKLMEDNEITEESAEYKDLELLRKERDAALPNSKIEITEEEQEQLDRIHEQGLTQFQMDMLEKDEAVKVYSSRKEAAEKGVAAIADSLRFIQIERLKEHPMVDAQKQVEGIMKQANDEIIGEARKEGMENIDEKLNEIVEKAEEEAEKKEEEEEKLEERKEKQEELEKQIEKIKESTSDDAADTSHVSTDYEKDMQEVVQVYTGKKSKADQELEKMIENLEVIMEDLKGVEVDVNL